MAIERITDQNQFRASHAVVRDPLTGFPPEQREMLRQVLASEPMCDALKAELKPMYHDSLKALGLEDVASEVERVFEGPLTAEVIASTYAVTRVAMKVREKSAVLETSETLV